MTYNEGKKPLIIFGVNMDKFHNDIKLLGKLPKFCHNLLFKPLNKNVDDDKNDIFEDNINIHTISNRKNYRLKRNEVSKLIERLTKVKPKKKSNKIKFDLFLKNNNINIDQSDLSPATLSFSSRESNKERNIVNCKLKKKKFFRNAFNISSSDKKNFDTSYINNLSQSRIINESKISLQKSNRNEYIKKWDLPKIIKFDKIIGREKEKPKAPHKFKKVEVAKRFYSPKFDYIYSSNSFSPVNYTPHYVKDFNKVKSNLTRKTICNFEKMRNSSSKGLYLFDVINDEKKRKEQLHLKKMKEKYGKLFDFLNYDINKHKLRLLLLNKNIKDL